MQKIDELLDLLRKNDLLAQKLAPKKKKNNTVLWVLAIVGAVLAIAAAAYGLYRYFKPDYLEDFEDDFEDDFDDDFFEDEDNEEDKTSEKEEDSSDETADYSEQE